MNEQDFQSMFDKSITAYSKQNLFGVSNIPAHQHTGVDSLQVDWNNLNNKQDFKVIRLLTSTTNTSVATKVGGDFVMPYNGYFLSLGATVDTAGVTNSTTIDVFKNGVSILSQKISISSTLKTSRNSNTPVLSNYLFKEGDIITFNVDSISTTPAIGLSIFMSTVITGGI